MEKILVYFGALIGVFFIGVGIYLIVGPPALDSKYQSLFGVLVILYGIFRSYRSWTLIQRLQQNSDDSE
ncbi:MAG: hypothetical protein LC115_11465 [Bacteroidia bacterium]|nr:hypothetical protein [Bacteroidia bacterium]